MPYAESGVTTGFIAQGVTTIKWGTLGMSTVCTVVDISQAAETENLNIENGAGIKSTRILLTQGVRWNITIIDDTNLTPPLIGDTVTLVNILGNGSVYIYKATIIENSAQVSRRQEQHRVLVAESLILIDTIAADGSPGL